MFPALLAGIGVIVGLYLIARWWSQAQPHQLMVALRWGAVVVAILLLIFVVLSKRWALLPVVAIPALAWLGRRRNARTFQRNAKGPSKGRNSTVETRFLRMMLDHDSGEIDGEVVAGPFAGESLGSMALGDQIELWRACVADDEQSRTVLEAYLDRVHGATWRQAAGGEASDSDAGRKRRDSPWAQSGMSEDEAREILGVDQSADKPVIEAAYRKAMLRAHPDQGGSDWLAARINQARDVLLDR